MPDSRSRVTARRFVAERGKWEETAKQLLAELVGFVRRPVREAEAAHAQAAKDKDDIAKEKTAATLREARETARDILGDGWPKAPSSERGERSSAMFPSTTCRLSVPLASSIFRTSTAVAEPTTVGAVDKVQAHVEATQAGQTRALVVKSEVYFRDRCYSREGARLQATLKDGSQLTPRENATLVVDEFIYDPSISRGALSLSVIRGAFLYVGGQIERVNGTKVQIRTPVGAMGLRGTTVWAAQSIKVTESSC